MFAMVPGLSSLESLVAPKPDRILLAEAILRYDDEVGASLAMKSDYVRDLDNEAMAKLGNLPLLHAACANDMGQTVHALLLRGANPEARWLGETPLHICARHDSSTAAQALLKAGARPWLQNNQGHDVKSLAERSTVLLAINNMYPVDDEDEDEFYESCSSTEEEDDEEENLRTPGLNGAKRTALYSHVNSSPLQTQSKTPENQATDNSILSETTPTVSELVKENRRLRAELTRLSTPRNISNSYSNRKIKASKTRLDKASERMQSREQRVLSACAATARAVASPASQARRVREVMDALCTVKDEATLDRVCGRLETDSTLLSARAFQCAHAYDGATVLHAAAAKGQIHVVRRLLKLGLDPLSLDPFGRTALHMAAANGHVQVALELKRAMASTIDGNIPIGENAPVDMAGRTPVAWAADRVKNTDQREALENALFLKGDQAVLPTPKSARKKKNASEKTQLHTVAISASHRRSMMNIMENSSIFVNCKAAAAAAPGFRIAMEDAHVVARLEDEDILIAAVFDGHGGNLCAKLAAAHLESHIRRALFLFRSKLDKEQSHADVSSVVLKDSLLSLDAELAVHPRLSFKKAPRGRYSTDVHWRAEDTSGTTATVVILFTGTNKKVNLVLGYLGDSRAALIDVNVATFLTGIHSPSEASESERLAKYVERAFPKKNSADQGNSDSPVVDYDDPPSIDNNGCLTVSRPATSLAMARALGDFLFKRRVDIDDLVDHTSAAVSAEPDVITMSRGADAAPAILVIASDGLWDVMLPAEVREILIQHSLIPRANASKIDDSVLHKDALQSSADALVAAAVTRKSRDNVTVILIDFKNQLEAQCTTEQSSKWRKGRNGIEEQNELRPTQLDFDSPLINTTASIPPPSSSEHVNRPFFNDPNVSD